MPANILLMLHYMFLPVKPKYHFWEFILEVYQSIGILCKINVKPLSVFSIKVVCCAVELNEFMIMTRVVKFGDVKMLADTKRDEDVMVQMEYVKGIIHLVQCFRGMDWISS